jgi:protein involved in polysaccharide export with SLBB domain
MSRPPTRLLAAALAFALPATGCSQFAEKVAAPSPGFPNIGYSTFAPNEPAYRMYPGDVLDVAFPSAPELNREVTVQPDGRIALPLVQPVMAADLSVPDLQSTLGQVYAGVLVRPEVDVSVRAATPLRIFVGGEVAKPGVYDMPGDVNALQAVVMAGGFSPVAKRREVILIRRGPGSGRDRRRATAPVRRDLCTAHGGRQRGPVRGSILPPAGAFELQLPAQRQPLRRGALRRGALRRGGETQAQAAVSSQRRAAR